MVEETNKAELAVKFINALKQMKSEELEALINGAAGEALAQFMIQYATTVIQADPTQVLKNASSLMLIGYLVRVNEERQAIQARLLFPVPAARA